VDAIVQAEVAIGLSLPQPFVASALRHDGQNLKSSALLGRWALLPLSQVVHKWLILGDSAGAEEDSDCVFTEGPVRPRLWDRSWVPFATTATGDYLALDLHPPAGGLRGQIVNWSQNSSFRSVVAPDFGAWLGQVLELLERRTPSPVSRRN
jgi:cell wall assembly regulator SMI1